MLEEHQARQMDCVLTGLAETVFERSLATRDKLSCGDSGPLSSKKRTLESASHAKRLSKHRSFLTTRIAHQ
jgi:hypothetical protein